MLNNKRLAVKEPVKVRFECVRSWGWRELKLELMNKAHTGLFRPKTTQSSRISMKFRQSPPYG